MRCCIRDGEGLHIHLIWRMAKHLSHKELLFQYIIYL